jgi:hypothetical protein
MQRPAFSQSPNRVGSGPSRPPISRGRPAIRPSAALGVDAGGEPGVRADEEPDVGAGGEPCEGTCRSGPAPTTSPWPACASGGANVGLDWGSSVVCIARDFATFWQCNTSRESLAIRDIAVIPQHLARHDSAARITDNPRAP